MARRPPGIRAKINLGLGVVLAIATIAFGASYAWMERTTVVDSNRQHLAHVASLVRLHLEASRGEHEITAALTDFAERLEQATGSRHHLILSTEGGKILATSETINSSERPAPGAEDGSNPISGALLPASLTVTVPVTLEGYEGRGALAARLTLEEPLAELPGKVVASLLRHFAFAAGLVGLALGSAAWLVHRLVIRPLGQLASATEEIARGGEWKPPFSGGRRADEIGVLEDCLAQMSRRIGESTRRERYGSAHLVALRVRRELDSPLREMEIRLAMLEKLLPHDSEEARVCREITSVLEEIAETRRRLQEVSSSPT